MLVGRARKRSLNVVKTTQIFMSSVVQVRKNILHSFVLVIVVQGKPRADAPVRSMGHSIHVTDCSADLASLVCGRGQCIYYSTAQRMQQARA